jgi:hypothetical protein
MVLDTQLSVHFGLSAGIPSVGFFMFLCGVETIPLIWAQLQTVQKDSTHPGAKNQAVPWYHQVQCLWSACMTGACIAPRITGLCYQYYSDCLFAFE